MFARECLCVMGDRADSKSLSGARLRQLKHRRDYGERTGLYADRCFKKMRTPQKIIFSNIMNR
jgi:hypothetical protein